MVTAQPFWLRHALQTHREPVLFFDFPDKQPAEIIGGAGGDFQNTASAESLRATSKSMRCLGLFSALSRRRTSVIGKCQR